MSTQSQDGQPVPISSNNNLVQKRAEMIQQQSVHNKNKKKYQLCHNTQLSREQVTMNTNNNRILLQLFPEEIWIMIFEKVKSKEDQAHCANTCPLFDRLLQSSKPLLIFDKIFPKIVDHLSKQDVYGLRLVCNDWRKCVDNFFENVLSFKKPQFGRYIYKWIPSFGFQYDFSYLDKTRPRSILSATHRKNPFIGRTVSIKIDKPQTRLSRPVYTFLRKFGSYIWHLQLGYDYNSDDKSISVYFATIQRFLRGCQNLRSLNFLDDYNGYIDTSEEDELPRNSEVLEVELPDLAHLESLMLESGFPQIGKVIDTLAQKYSSQLKYFYVSSWNSDLYCLLNWNSLQHLVLTFSDEIHSPVYTSLCKLQAPNLCKLGMKLCFYAGEGEPINLENMLRVVKSFPSLISLEFEFYDEMGFQNNQVLKIPDEFGFCENIEEISVCAEHVTELDFLIFFPMVKHLKLVHHTEYSSDNYNHDLQQDLVDIMYWSNEALVKENDFTLIYKSNIWEILSRMQVLKDVNGKIQRTYTRLGFESKLTQLQICDKIYQLAKREADFQHSLKRLELKERMAKLRTPIATKSKTCENKQNTTSNQILEFVLPFLQIRQVLLCRTICQNWKLIIDNTLEKNNMVVAKTARQNPQFVHKFHIPMLKTELNRKNRMVASPANPFVGRNVIIELTHQKKEWSQANLRQFREFLRIFGVYIWHLTISGGEQGAWVNIQHYYEQLIVLVLEQCQNLKTLILKNVRMDTRLIPFERRELPDHKSLQVLDFDAKYMFTGQEYHVIFNEFHQQIKSLKVHSFFFDANTMGLWNNLEELEVLSEYVSKAVYEKQRRQNPIRVRLIDRFDTIYQLNAPNLKRLSLTVIGGKDELLNLVLFTRHFPSLDTLALNFLKEPLNCSASEISIMTPDLISSTKLVCMELTVTEKMICYDFLHFFPFISKLVVCEVFEIVEKSKDKFSNRVVTELVSVKKKSLDVKAKTPDVLSVKFASYVPQIWGNLEVNVCKNVWEILPSLDRVEVSKKHVFSDAEISKRKILFRQ